MVSFSAIKWLQLLLRQRLHPEVTLSFDSKNLLWHLGFSDHSETVYLPFIPQLYLLGPQPDLPCTQWYTVSEGFFALEPELPVPALAEIPQPLVEFITDGVYVGYDILGLIYWMLARCEEVNPPIELLDDHGRFPALNSHAVEHRYLDRPIVDEWLEVLGQLLQRLWPRLSLNQHQFHIVVSHDVDVPSAYFFGPRRFIFRSLLARLLKYRDPVGVLNAPRILLANRTQLHPADPFNTFEWLMDQSEAVGIRSAFYFMCGRTNPHLDAHYELEHPAIRALMRRIYQRGHEIGLHPSYNTCNDPNAIASEAARLQRVTRQEGIYQSEWGGRMHCLRWNWPITAKGWVQAGFHYDSTLSYADRPGFRCGTCHAYRMFDPISQLPLNLQQRPLIVMECSIIAERYLGLGYGLESFSLFKKLIDRCRRVNGSFSLLWHNSHFNTEMDFNLYASILQR